MQADKCLCHHCESQNCQDLNAGLTTTEVKVLEYIGRGCTNKQIASNLAVSEQTIKNETSTIYRKLNVRNRTQAVIVGIKQYLLRINPSKD